MTTRQVAFSKYILLPEHAYFFLSTHAHTDGGRERESEELNAAVISICRRRFPRIFESSMRSFSARAFAISHRSAEPVYNKALRTVVGLTRIRKCKNNEIYEKKNPIKSKFCRTAKVSACSFVGGVFMCERRLCHYQPLQVPSSTILCNNMVWWAKPSLIQKWAMR